MQKQIQEVIRQIYYSCPSYIGHLTNDEEEKVINNLINEFEPKIISVFRDVAEGLKEKYNKEENLELFPNGHSFYLLAKCNAMHDVLDVIEGKIILIKEETNNDF